MKICWLLTLLIRMKHYGRGTTETTTFQVRTNGSCLGRNIHPTVVTLHKMAMEFYFQSAERYKIEGLLSFHFVKLDCF